MKKLWTVARFPNGSWSYGGNPTDPVYAGCEVFRISAVDGKAAVKKAQAQRSRERRLPVGRAAMPGKAKLSPGELAFMTVALDESGGKITSGTMINYDHTEGRAVGGLEKKGLVIRREGEVEVTEIGAAWFSAAAERRAAEARRVIDFARNNVPGFR